MKKLLMILTCALIAACTAPGDETYCKSLGITKGHAEYGNCKAYYTRMDNWFRADLAECTGKAAASYPDYLYDHPHYGQSETIDRYGMIRTSNIIIEPDYRRNASLDEQRRRIITPCMSGKGWLSPDSWQAGRRNESSPYLKQHQ